ncbi:hypothetical protein M433DRAFT_171101 [Acidomyces richmondensis BFW]|nr:hypothetical protein M433DRAFT_171101 [Acidomyces richmondensis BFW]
MMCHSKTSRTAYSKDVMITCPKPKELGFSTVTGTGVVLRVLPSSRKKIRGSKLAVKRMCAVTNAQESKLLAVPPVPASPLPSQFYVNLRTLPFLLLLLSHLLIPIPTLMKAEDRNDAPFDLASLTKSFSTRTRWRTVCSSQQNGPNDDAAAAAEDVRD